MNINNETIVLLSNKEINEIQSCLIGKGYKLYTLTGTPTGHAFFSQKWVDSLKMHKDRKFIISQKREESQGVKDIRNAIIMSMNSLVDDNDSEFITEFILDLESILLSKDLESSFK